MALKAFQVFMHAHMLFVTCGVYCMTAKTEIMAVSGVFINTKRPYTYSGDKQEYYNYQFSTERLDRQVHIKQLCPISEILRF